MLFVCYKNVFLKKTNIQHTFWSKRVNVVGGCALHKIQNIFCLQSRGDKESYRIVLKLCYSYSWILFCKNKEIRTNIVTPERCLHSVSTALNKLKIASNTVKTLCNRLERHAVAFILNMLKTNTADYRLQSVLDSALRGRCVNAVGSSRASWRVVCAPRARCKDAL